MPWCSVQPVPLKLPVNSVCSSAAGAAAAPAPPAAGAAPTGAAEIVTLNFVLKASISSASSNTDMFPIASRISSLLMVALAIVVFSLEELRAFALSLERVERACKHRKQSIEGADKGGRR